MPKVAAKMSAIEVSRLDKAGLYSVGGVPGLALQVTKTGARSWILRATVGVKRRDIGLGSFGELTLADAREKARELRAKIRAGIDPVEEREAARAALIASQLGRITFAEAAQRAHKARAAEFKNAKHAAQWLSTLETYAVPVIGAMDVADIETSHVQQVLEPIWHTKTETASRLRGRIESVFSWATVSKYRSGDNPARWADNLKELMPRPSKIRTVEHHPALPLAELPQFMAALGKRKGMAARALEFAILCAARSGEVRGATWDEVDLDAGLWTIPGARMKAGREHVVPLSNEAMAVLRNLPRMQGSDYVFPAPRGGQLSDMSLSAVMRRMEAEAVPHGFRSSFKDWCRSGAIDSKGRRFADEVSELAMAHVSTDATRAAYARDQLLPQRQELMDGWARFCYPAQAADNVTPIKRAEA